MGWAEVGDVGISIGGQVWVKEEIVKSLAGGLGVGCLECLESAKFLLVDGAKYAMSRFSCVALYDLWRC